MRMRQTGWYVGLLALCVSQVIGADSPETAIPDYTKQVAPILQKYCVGCHGTDEPDGKLSLATYAELQKGGEHGAAVLAGDAESSRLLRLVQGVAEPMMPPKGEPRPTADEIATLVHWVTAGARGPNGAEPDPLKLVVPVVPSHTDRRPVTALDIDPTGRLLAVGRFGEVEVVEILTEAQSGVPQRQQVIRNIDGLPGKVTSLHFARIAVPDNVEGATGVKSSPKEHVETQSTRNVLVVASGVAGRGGIVSLHDVETGAVLREFRGHRDMLFDAEVSPNGKLLATCSYDKEIRLWDIVTGEQLRVLTGHNGAVYDVAFHPSSEFLASASADDTVKLWRVSDGERMDTLGQPLKEEYAVTFTPDGKRIIAGGADNTIRVWRFISTDRPRINPMLFARFAHEGPIVSLQLTADGKQLVTIAEDRKLKVWETKEFTELSHEPLTQLTAVLVLTPPSSNGSAPSDSTRATTPEVHCKQFAWLGDLSGQLRTVEIPPAPRPLPENPNLINGSNQITVMADGPMQKLEEVEPNNQASQAQWITLPAAVTGVIGGAGTPSAAGLNGIETSREVDVDSFKFTAKQGEEWVFEVNASRSKSPLDSFLEVLDATGQRVERVQLQAVKESYFTFRGKDADQTGDFRVFNWEEMELNEYLYANGEVVKLWLYPRGPDSGYEVYPGSGKRWGYFDTTPLSHALGEPCYIVEPRAPGESIIPNGLPVFPLYFENDDEAHRELGADSKLTFIPPADGEYIVRVRDVRGFEGDDFKYTLTVRPRRPGFIATIAGGDKTINAGSSKEFKVNLKRVDNYEGPVQIDIAGLPPGYTVTSPIVIEAGQIEAYGTITAAVDAPPPPPEAEASSTATATAIVRGSEVVAKIGGLGKIVRADASQLSVAIVADPEGVKPISPTSLNVAATGTETSPGNESPLEFEIEPGETIRLRVKVVRGDFKGEVSFGKEGAGRNLPHGLYVDNIGLNGLLLLEGESEREFFITAAPWVPEQSRLFHLNTGADGGQASSPVMLHVRSTRSTK